MQSLEGTSVVVVVEALSVADAAVLRADVLRAGFAVRDGYGHAQAMGIYLPPGGDSRAFHVVAELEAGRELGGALRAEGFELDVGRVEDVPVAFFSWPPG